MRALVEDLFAAACWLAAFAGFALLLVGFGA
jgi:hypothetical protein